MQHLADMLEEGELKSEVSKLYPFEKMAEAHEQLVAGGSKGKIIVAV